MDLIAKNECCGCGACANICPRQAIKMEADDEGFRYPHINEEKCIQCSLCKNVCPVKVGNEPEQHKENAYAAYNVDSKERSISSSGGIFILAAKEILCIGGIVYAVAFDSELRAVHQRCTNEDELDKFVGSKYVQSNMEKCYHEIADDLKNQKSVLFVGTPCQVKSINNYLELRRIRKENLITVDFICHGVPSPLAWEKYIRQKEKAHSAKIHEANFRSKISGWKKFSMKITFNDNSEYSAIMDNDVYLDSFFRNLTLRQSCFNCSQKGMQKSSDLTMADFWGIEKEYPEFGDNKGCSFVVINSEKGEKFFQKIRGNVIVKKIDFENGIKHNKCWYESVKKPPQRDKFMKELKSTEDFERLSKKYAKKTGIWVLVRKIMSR